MKGGKEKRVLLKTMKNVLHDCYRFIYKGYYYIFNGNAIILMLIYTKPTAIYRGML